MDKAAALAKAGIQIIEYDRDAIAAEISTDVGVVNIVANLVFIEDVLVLDGVHVDGRGLTRTKIANLRKSLAKWKMLGKSLFREV